MAVLNETNISHVTILPQFRDKGLGVVSLCNVADHVRNNSAAQNLYM